MGRKIILASASPRRREILKTAGFDFEVRPSDVDESDVTGNPEELVMKLAKIKAQACVSQLGPDEIVGEGGYLVIGSDTLVFLDDKQLGKPQSTQQWREYLKGISGRSHKVMTGVCICTEELVDCSYAATTVYVEELTDAEIDEYISYGNDMDKAGGYAIQGLFSKYITSIEGEYNNVVGFPVAAFNKRIKELGISGL